MPAIKEQKRKEMIFPENLRSVSDVLAPLDAIARQSASLVRKPLPACEADGCQFQIPRYLFLGPKGGAEPIRAGIFAGVHGDEPEGTYALLDFIQGIDKAAHIARDYCLFIYPVLNPSGFESHTRFASGGVNITNELWKNTTSPEAQQIQSELWMHGFEGIISLKTDPSASELLIAVGGSIFFRHLLGNALSNAQDLLPQTVHTGRDALPPFKSALLEQPNELIRAAPGLKPRPFEIVITIPRQAPSFVQRAAVGLLLERVLTGYREFISYGANL